MAKTIKSVELQDVPVEKKLKQLYELQCIDSKINELLVLRGELPIEVKDLERVTDDIKLQMKGYDEDIKELNASVSQKKKDINTAENLIGKYKAQIDDVRNNREHESLTKEIEFQMLEIELCEKKIREFGYAIDDRKKSKEALAANLSEKQKTLEDKQNALQEITNETKREVDELNKQANACRKHIEDRLLIAYDRVRGNARNGLAVVLVKRGACGGCFNKIPPQRQVDIKLNKKIAVCEYCGRFLVSEDLI
jgi:predicted  nucleic acid-binding Zn-ribbon protein